MGRAVTAVPQKESRLRHSRGCPAGPLAQVLHPTVAALAVVVDGEHSRVDSGTIPIRFDRGYSVDRRTVQGTLEQGGSGPELSRSGGVPASPGDRVEPAR